MNFLESLETKDLLSAIIHIIAEDNEIEIVECTVMDSLKKSLHIKPKQSSTVCLYEILKMYYSTYYGEFIRNRRLEMCDLNDLVHALSKKLKINIQDSMKYAAGLEQEIISKIESLELGKREALYKSFLIEASISLYIHPLSAEE